MWYWPFLSSKKKSQVVEKKGVLGTSHGLGAFLTYGAAGAGTPYSAFNLYRDSTAVSIPINKVAEAFAQITPVLKNAGGEITAQHPVLDLLRCPSPHYTCASLFFETVAKQYLVTNESIIVALGNTNKPPLELQPISPVVVTVDKASHGAAGVYRVTGMTLPGNYKLDVKKNRFFDGPLRELHQIRGYSTRDNGLLRGESLLVPAAAEARQHILGNRHNISILEKGGRLSVVFNFEEDMSEDDYEDIKETVRNEFGGASSAGRIGVTTGGKLNIQEFGKTNKDMDFEKLQRMAMNSIALQYNVPLPLLSNSAATFNNFKEATLALYDSAVLPLATRIFSELSWFLLPRFGLNPRDIQISYDILSIPALRVRTLEEIKLRREINIETDNELRNMIGRDDYSGGDQILKPANLIPVDAIASAPAVLRDE